MSIKVLNRNTVFCNVKQSFRQWVKVQRANQSTCKNADEIKRKREEALLGGGEERIKEQRKKVILRLILLFRVNIRFISHDKE